jgi:predicted nucleotidyltransferase
MIHPHHIQNLLIQKSQRILGKHPVSFAYLYGSFATAAVHPFSDVDIGIHVRGVAEDEHLALELGISLEFDEELPGNVQSDLRVINDLPLSLAGQIVTDGVLIYCRDNATRIDFETSVRMAYFDFVPMLKMHQNAFMNRVVSG